MLMRQSSGIAISAQRLAINLRWESKLDQRRILCGSLSFIVIGAAQGYTDSPTEFFSRFKSTA